jgi:hypothetical protein
VQLVKWDTRADRFEAGQWFHGRIYDRRCDLSPDGSLLIYFASKFNARTLRDPGYTYAWTAISKPPYFTALALWPKGDCWHGGGLFETARWVWLNHKPEVAKPHPNHKPKRLQIVPNPEAHGEDGPVWHRRMERDGWSLVQTGSYRPRKDGWETERAEIWERRSPRGGVLLRRRLDAINFRKAGGPYVESFRLTSPTGAKTDLPNVSWADWDQRGRLVFARGGMLYAGEFEEHNVVERLLVDLNGNTPRCEEPPAWATRWE